MDIRTSVDETQVFSEGTEEMDTDVFEIDEKPETNTFEEEPYIPFDDFIKMINDNTGIDIGSIPLSSIMMIREKTAIRVVDKLKVYIAEKRKSEGIDANGIRRHLINIFLGFTNVSTLSDKNLVDLVTIFAEVPSNMCFIVKNKDPYSFNKDIEEIEF